MAASSSGNSAMASAATWSTTAHGAQFLELCQGDRYYFPFHFLATSGCRRSEALGLRWSDVDLDKATAAIRQSVVPLTQAAGRGREGVVQERTKTGPRLIELDGATITMLRTWKARQAEEKLLMGAGYRDHNLIFCRPDGDVFHPESFSKTFVRRLEQPAFRHLPALRLHDLRHSWASMALADGVPAKVVAERLGHRSVMTTLTIYAHVSPGMQTDAAERVANLIFRA